MTAKGREREREREREQEREREVITHHLFMHWFNKYLLIKLCTKYTRMGLKTHKCPDRGAQTYNFCVVRGNRNKKINKINVKDYFKLCQIL
jgi:hypothetical protein